MYNHYQKIVRKYVLLGILYVCTYVTQIVIPDTDTTYWCTAIELPAEVQSQEKYIIRVY